MMLALGDAIALTVSKKKKFTKNAFGSFHPGGNIGAKFTLIKDIMHKGKHIPLAAETSKMSDILIEMSHKGFGCVGITNKSKKLVGIITDGDLRRNMTKDLLIKNAKDVMNKKPNNHMFSKFSLYVGLSLYKAARECDRACATNTRKYD